MATNSIETPSAWARLCVAVEEAEGQALGSVADAEGPPRADHVDAERLAVARGESRNERLVEAEGNRLVQQPHRSQDLVLPASGVEATLEGIAGAGDRPRRQQRRHQHEADRPPPVERQHARPGAGHEQREDEDVHRRQQRPEARVQNARRDEELEHVFRDAEQLEKERHGEVDAAEQTRDSGERKRQPLETIDRDAREPTGEHDEGQAQDLRDVGEVVGDGKNDVDQRARLRALQLMAPQKLLAAHRQNRNHDELARRGEGRDERVP
jgi:hypothetical protein